VPTRSNSLPETITRSLTLKHFIASKSNDRQHYKINTLSFRLEFKIIYAMNFTEKLTVKYEILKVNLLK